MLVATGTTAIRTHADVTVETGTRHAEALIGRARPARGLVDIQVVALMGHTEHRAMHGGARDFALHRGGPRRSTWAQPLLPRTDAPAG